MSEEIYAKETDAAAEAALLVNWLSAALSDGTPMELPEGMDFEAVYRLSIFHGLSNLAFYSVTKLQRKPDPGLYAEWQRQCLTNAAKIENQLRQRDRIIERLTAAGIDLLPMKGCRLVELYPRPDYRMMTDLDMLIPPEKAEQVRDLMVGMGYRVEKFGNFHNDAYLLPPYVAVEMHRNVGEEIGKDSTDLERAIFGYSESIRERMLPVEGRPHLYRLDDTEFYIEMILHFAKHALISAGSGIRSVMDVHVCLSACGDRLDRARIDAVMAELRLTDFLRLAETLADAWFGGSDEAAVRQTFEGDGELAEFARALLTSGLFGTRERKNRLRMAQIGRDGNRKSVKRRFFLYRAFPPLRLMKIRYKILWKLPILLPFCWMIRLIDALLFRRDAVRTDLDVMK